MSSASPKIHKGLDGIVADKTAVSTVGKHLQRERLAKGTTNINFLRKWLFLLEIRLSVFRAGWVTDFSLIIQKVDIRGTFCYTTELVARGGADVSWICY